MKVIKILITNILLGCIAAALMGINPLYGAGACTIGGLISPALPGLKATIFREVWTGETIKAFRASIESIGWLNRLKNCDKYAENDVIHFVDLGGDPDVLVNNNTYPLEVQELEDGDKVVTLDRYQTKPTPVTDDEIYASSYDKMATVIERHKEKVLEAKYGKALHSLAPAANTKTTPVILTTGAADSGRATCSKKDILALKKAFDVAKVPVADRILVLCPDHINDLLANDQKFAEQYYNYTTGKIANMYSFEVYEFVDCPYYNVATLEKNAFGAASVSTAAQASIAFYAKDCIRASGSTKTYLSESKNDPLNQRSLYNLRHYFIALPLKNRALGAIVSGVASDPSSLELTTQKVGFPKSASTRKVDVVANGEITIAGEVEGFTAAVEGKTITISATANTGVERSGSFTVSLVDYPAVKETISFVQATGAAV